jgi:hypothetical protein
MAVIVRTRRNSGDRMVHTLDLTIMLLLITKESEPTDKGI